MDVTYQMNLQSPGSALLPELTKSFVQHLRMALAEALDDEAGAKMAEELGIRVADEAPEEKVERLAYLAKVRRLFQQGAEEDVDDGALLLYLLCSLKTVLQVSERRVAGLQVLRYLIFDFPLASHIYNTGP